MDAPKYPIATIDDIARIPEEALPRFLAELPAILKARELVKAAIPDLAVNARTNAPGLMRFLPLSMIERVLSHQMLTKGLWVDDDKGTITLTMRAKPGDDPFFSQTEKLGDR